MCCVFVPSELCHKSEERKRVISETEFGQANTRPSKSVSYPRFCTRSFLYYPHWVVKPFPSRASSNQALKKHPVNPSGLSTHISAPAPALRWPQPGLLSPVLRPPALTLLRCALSRKVKCTMINSSRVLVLAMLSTASGWGLPSHDPLFSSNDTAGGVDGARDQRQLFPFGVGGDWSALVSRQPPPRALALWPVHLAFSSPFLRTQSLHLPRTGGYLAAWLQWDYDGGKRPVRCVRRRPHPGEGSAHTYRCHVLEGYRPQRRAVHSGAGQPKEYLHRRRFRGTRLSRV